MKNKRLPCAEKAIMSSGLMCNLMPRFQYSTHDTKQNKLSASLSICNDFSPVELQQSSCTQTKKLFFPLRAVKQNKE